MTSPLFDYPYVCSNALDRGLKRESNQDKLILCPEAGFYGLSDGMGGLAQGGKTAEILAEVIPPYIREISAGLAGNVPDPKRAGELFKGKIEEISDKLYNSFNTGARSKYGATFCGVWLIGRAAVFVSIGDSRAYLLPRHGKIIRQLTNDHNIAAILIRNGELTVKGAKNHPSANQLTRFVGMEAPAEADCFIEPLAPGDRILLCSDGLHGLMEDDGIKRILRSSRSPALVCGRLVKAANESGGRDNISAVYIKL
ncbi:MAG: protein phosphatase 2C domain-containing protein [Treponema sp.]|jgi:serine/threonine protein phosphatase PrpC|nr:protein phosphatase 2C domain-containing protein [Treponema sp.]